MGGVYKNVLPPSNLSRFWLRSLERVGASCFKIFTKKKKCMEFPSSLVPAAGGAVKMARVRTLQNLGVEATLSVQKTQRVDPHEPPRFACNWIELLYMSCNSLRYNSKQSSRAQSSCNYLYDIYIIYVQYTR